MTLAYVFWHRPNPDTATQVYEGALKGFHAALAEQPPPGFQGSSTYRVGPRPWIPDGGYEDWYYVDDFTALGALNAGAVDAAHQGAHHEAAARAAWGTAGLFLLRAGTTDGGHTHHVWSDQRPDEAIVWQRQMVLGPTPEWCAMTAAGAPADLAQPLQN